MGKWVRRFMMILLLAIFLFAAGSIVVILRQYQTDEQFYADVASQYMFSEDGEENGEAILEGTEAEEAQKAPIHIDFESLQAANSDVEGWIYCEDTAINYPVLRGDDNNIYLRRTYDGNYSAAGSIFMDASNRSAFADSNTIIYGHNMKNGSMFAALQNWADQEFYEEHPVMWLLTPEQDYKVVLFSGYAVSAYSDVYTIFTGPCGELDEYLDRCVERSDFQTDFVPDQNGQYILLSTCVYMFENARYVLHGMLIPVDR